MASEDLGLVAIYRRTVQASLARIWENVLDWEHLPWLHRSSFAGIRLQEADGEGWRADVTLPSSGLPSHALVDVRLARADRRYLTRTLTGVGAGTEILTYLEPVDKRATHIRVEFRVPGVSPDAGDAVGAMYTQLYTRLWDEDEGMMIRRQVVLDEGAPAARATAPDPIALGSVAALRQRLPTCIEVHRRLVRLIAVDGDIRAYPTVCPHRGGPLDEGEVENGHVTCPWHGYRFDLRSGQAEERNLRLEPLGCVRINATTGEAFLEWPALD